VVVVHVDKGDQRPYRTASGQYYVRGGARCRRASREELLRLFQAVRSLYYDENPVRRASLGDLDRDAVEKYLEQTGLGELRGDVERVLRNWRLCDDQHPTVAGLLLFGHDPQTHLPHAQINAARFPGTDDSEEPLDRKDLKGQLLDVIDQARRFLALHLATPHKIEGFKPEPRPELPEEVLREAIVNAVAHRDYSVDGPIRLFVFRYRVEVRTPGRAPNTVDEEAMRAGVHVVRNPHIYARLSDAGMVTRAGTGVRRIVRLVRQTTGQEVTLFCRDFEVYLSIPRPMGSP
jgi:ATP-dependent DNA helicase RecG